MRQMQFARTLTFPSSAPAPRTLGIGIVAAIHVAAISVLITALSEPVDVQRAPPPLGLRFIEEAQPQQPLPPPPVLRIDPIAPPEAPAIPAIEIAPPPGPTNAIGTRPSGPPLVAPSRVPPTTPAEAISETLTRPPYPPLSRRFSEEGSVRLALIIGLDGMVIDARILETSGHARLDDAAQQWVLLHWRYKPATRDGMPVTAMMEARLRFQLR